MTRGRVKNLIHACFYLEKFDNNSQLKNGLLEFERDHYIEELRLDRIN